MRDKEHSRAAAPGGGAEWLSQRQARTHPPLYVSRYLFAKTQTYEEVPAGKQRSPIKVTAKAAIGVALINCK